jgi:hypothetical protein
LRSRHSLSYSKFPTLYGIRRFIIMFRWVLHWSLHYATLILSISAHLISLTSILILSYHLRLVLLSGFFPSGFPAKIRYAFFFSPCVLHILPLRYLREEKSCIFNDISGISVLIPVECWKQNLMISNDYVTTDITAWIRRNVGDIIDTIHIDWGTR